MNKKEKLRILIGTVLAIVFVLCFDVILALVGMLNNNFKLFAVIIISLAFVFTIVSIIIRNYKKDIKTNDK